MARLPSTSTYWSLSFAAPSTVSLMVATDAFVANHMFLLVKSGRSVYPRMSGVTSVLAFDFFFFASFAAFTISAFLIR
jgi:hypothetical protein